MPTPKVFGFGSAGFGSDSYPFANIYGYNEILAGKTLLAFSASVAVLSQRKAVEGAVAYDASASTPAVNLRTVTRHFLTVTTTYNEVAYTANVSQTESARKSLTTRTEHPHLRQQPRTRTQCRDHRSYVTSGADWADRSRNVACRGVRSHPREFPQPIYAQGAYTANMPASRIPLNAVKTFGTPEGTANA